MVPPPWPTITMPQLVIPLADIPDTGKEFSFSLVPAFLNELLADAELGGVEGTEGHVKVQVHRMGEEYAISGRVEAPVSAPCIRCLEPVRVDASSKVTRLLAPRATAASLPEELELSAEDLDRDYYEGDELALDDIVREQLILEVPMQPLCAEDCPGIEIPAHVKGPDDFGGPAGVDPRLAPLMQLKGAIGDDSSPS